MTMRLAFFDDYPGERGHHPDLIVGLGIAAHAPLYCPDPFLDGRSDAVHLPHRTVVGDRDNPARTKANLEDAHDDAGNRGCDTFVNLFLDENWDSFPIRRGGLRLVHSLHRPGEFTGILGGVNAFKPGDAVAVLRSLARTDLVIVHTAVGEQQIGAWLPADNILRLGWPAAHTQDIRQRFASSSADVGKHEPYVLLIGEALGYKGIHCLLEALNPGPPLRIAGNLAVGDGEWLACKYPKARVTWEPSWVTRPRLDDLVAGATVVIFPYLPAFDAHGGVSGALVHALTFAKPIVVSEALASQAPASPSCLVVPVGDAGALRSAIDQAMAGADEMCAAAQDLESFILREHTYERHAERLVERLTEADSR
jgi:hypothetical protein